ncbi:MAG: non-canonical purine NTP pyrophosphatase, partial [Candidatus Micrarchaeota archaeon]
MKLLFITSNKNKFREAERVLKRYGIILLHGSVVCPEARAETCEKVALTSAGWVLEKLKRPRAFILEDAGLFIRALNGFPGTYSAWVHRKIGSSGI